MADTAARDFHSFAQPDVARVTHVGLDLRADFEARQLIGRATLDLALVAGARELRLDSRDLEISAVTDGRAALEFDFGAPDPILGRALSVRLPAGVRRVVVSYRTSPDAPALQWLAPEQTASKQHPFLFSQGQAILTRSWIPTQDSPAIRQTFEARVVVPEPMVAVMGAEPVTRGAAPGDERSFEFKMVRPIPSYLIALAIGDLRFRPLGDRTGVFAEPPMIERATHEFAELERMLEAAEALAGPYRWGRHDVLVLPPSFPFGGMENPCLTFMTPTVLAGDRSLTAILAHEIAHGWSGNLVGNATWNDFWLNEGFTVYLELRMVEVLWGPRRAAMLESYGRRELARELTRLGAEDAATTLYRDLGGHDPADAVTVVPYLKGAAFLQVVERAVGRERFDSYLRSWFDRHAFGSVTTEQFVSDLRMNLLGADRVLEEEIGVDRWVYGPGLPDNAVPPRGDPFAEVDAQVEAFVSGKAAQALTTREWGTQEWRQFLGTLPRSLGSDRLRDLDDTFTLSHVENCEILFAWLRLVIANRYEPGMPALRRFLGAQGRRKFVKPLYEDLMATDWGKDRARRWYRSARRLYHSVTRAALDPIIG